MDLSTIHPKLTYVLLLAVISLTFISCDDDNDDEDNNQELLTIVETIEDDEDFDSLTEALTDAGLNGILSGDGPFTIFAPTNEAFADLPEETLDTLTNEQLSQVFAYHVLQGITTTDDLDEQQDLESIEGSEIFIEVDDDIVLNDNATVVNGDIEATNGTIHAIDRIIFPDSYLNVVGIIAKRFTLEELQNSLEDADLIETLQEDTEDGYTIFAPDNDAFEDTDLPSDEGELEDLMNYHIVPSRIFSDDIEDSVSVETVNGEELTIEVSNGTITINGTAEVTTDDLEGTNGVVHIIDEVLELPAN